MSLELLHIARAGAEIGSYDLAEVHRQLQAGVLRPTDHYWRAGLADWLLLGTLDLPREALAFPRPADKAPNFLDDLLSRENKVTGLQALWDMLAVARPRGLVAEADMVALSTRVGFDVRRRCAEELAGWYRLTLMAYLADRLFTPPEKMGLANLARTFGFDEVTALKLHREEFTRYYSLGVRTCLQRTAPPEVKAQQITLLAHEVPLPSGVLSEVRAEVLGQYLETVFKDKMEVEDDDELLAPAQVTEMQSLALALGVELATQQPGFAQRLAQSARLWKLYRAPLVPLGEAHELGTEGCYWQHDVQLYQKKRVVVRRNYGGFSSSIKIFGSLRYRVGSYDVQRETEDQVVLVDTGRLLFSAQRVIFDGQLKNFNFKYAKVLDVTSYTNALVISRDSGADLIFLFPSGQVEAAIILRRLVRQAKR